MMIKRGICKGGSGKKSRILSPIGFVPRYQQFAGGPKSIFTTYMIGRIDKDT